MIHYSKFSKYNIEITNNTICCFDIEVSSFWLDGNKIIKYDSKLPDEYYNNIKKGSVVYIWQFGIDDDGKDRIFYGRDLNEFKIFFDKIRAMTDKLYIYIHNAAYEFQFLRNILPQFDNVFARTMRKPMKFTYENVEFRCSYQLTHLSLASWGKQLGIPKKSGDLDYTLLLTPFSKLTKKQLGYCEYDIKIMLAGLRKYRDKYGDIKHIVLTSTGEVRKVVKDMYKKDYGYHSYITKLQMRDVEEYKIARLIFAGGDTHANAAIVGEVIEDAESQDETSEYPAVMFRKKYPITRFTKTIQRSNFDFDKYAYIFCIELWNIRSKNTLSYLSKSRCAVVNNGVYDNGRIVSADYICLYCTEQDYIYIWKMYNISRINYLSVRRAVKGYLDKKYIDFILQLFKDKSTLKNVEGFEDLYLQQKSFLNALYGLMVQDPVNINILFDGVKWSADEITTEYIQTQLDELQTKKYKNFTSYYFGCWVTAYARADLWRILTDIIKAGGEKDILYYDTDSCKFAHPEKYRHIFEARNKEIIKENEAAAQHFGYKDKPYTQRTSDGEITTLGLWSFDGHYEKFITQGAKRYCFEKHGELYITVAGVPKECAKCLDNIEDFADGFRFFLDGDDINENKGLSTYLDGDNPAVIFPDGYELIQPYGLNIRNIGYTMGLTNEFKHIIEYMKERGEI